MIRLFFTGNTRYLRLGGSRLPNIGSLIIPVRHSSFIDSISSGCTCSLRRQSRPFRSRCRRATARLVQYGGKVVYNSQVAARYMYFWAVINTVHVLTQVTSVLYLCTVARYCITSICTSTSFPPPPPPPPSDHPIIMPETMNVWPLPDLIPHIRSWRLHIPPEVPRYLVTVFSHT